MLNINDKIKQLQEKLGSIPEDNKIASENLLNILKNFVDFDYCWPFEETSFLPCDYSEKGKIYLDIITPFEKNMQIQDNLLSSYILVFLAYQAEIPEV